MSAIRFSRKRPRIPPDCAGNSGRRGDVILLRCSCQETRSMMSQLINKSLNLEPLDPERREFFRMRTEKALSESPHLKKLHDLLVGIGGEAVVLWNGSNRERFVNDLIELGKAESAHELRMQPGEPGNCHENSQRLTSEHPRRYL